MAGKRFQRVYFILNLFFGVCYLLVCLVPFLRSGNFWFIAILGLVFPYLLAVLVIFLLIALFRRNKNRILMNGIVLLLGIQQILAVVAFRMPHAYNDTHPENSLRILSWNVNRWVEGNTGFKSLKGYRKMMMDELALYDADVLCFQEFFECIDSSWAESSVRLLKQMGYPYYYFSPSSKIFDERFQFGITIFSRFPIADSAHFITADHPHSEGYSLVDLKIGGSIVRVFTTHLESFGIRSHDLMRIINTKRFIQRIKSSYELRSQQADSLADAIARSPYPVIVTGDLDDVPNSYTYFKIKRGLYDVFLKKGIGLGGTVSLNSLLPDVRIDYIFADKRLNVIQFQQFNSRYSDHQALLADLQIIN